MKVRTVYIETIDGKTYKYDLPRKMTVIYAKKAALQKFGLQYKEVKEFSFEEVKQEIIL